ncbi:MAG: hypothetical protein A2X45_00105 [Lentisphaerae bacterium GWF2_50_93]|nr:MAG: hypothetical protein A2X45_00105 [Lentisphaerae bacterium GWF2_50_93]
MPVFCPKCHSLMTVRHRRNDSGKQFYGCSKYPKCKGTRDIAEVIPFNTLSKDNGVNQRIVNNMHKVIKRLLP